ncbi:hypothetical protein P153DRAFT_389660 [Dothidotthia symphoricarpi CBS 119687]|uniref:RING-type domain-containing protein n=1 Tax=Dothidotthia symphoricarpi CBS 119687 TaxID=1392245 RepID=A0A6A6A432_9PLEO|nr:uncharacterized protein P153DRAFT_389660 [Dothidotthia symphoricarpi CBS 119687]KAF2125508.1 hypothetical protein P153DRAFT_389660 [Dothidotthia symphoricarpi CBS 119687]
MPFCHKPQSLVPANAIQVTVDIVVEISESNTSSNSYDMARPTTPPIPVPSMTTIVASSSQHISAPVGEQLPSGDAFAQAALLSIVQSERLGFYPTFSVSDLPPLIPVFTAEEAVSQIRRSMEELACLGQRLTKSEKLEFHAEVAPAEDIELSQSVSHWVFSLATLQQVDFSLYHILRDSLYPHTPRHIFLRWNAFRSHLNATGHMLANVVRQAEELPQRKWSPLLWEFYFLLLDHNNALAEDASFDRTNPDSIGCQLSAYCIALRIRFYLWRMSQKNPMCSLRTYRRRVQAEKFRDYLKELLAILAQEFNRQQDPALGHLPSVQRTIVGRPVDVASITEPLSGATYEFCSICQDEHAAVACVKSLECNCVFGRDCLEPLLNRDTPFSSTCPNCRAHFHKPLKWKSIQTTSDRELQVVSLWSLRYNMASLKREIMADPEPFVARQRLVDWASRLIHGR